MAATPPRHSLSRPSAQPKINVSRKKFAHLYTLGCKIYLHSCAMLLPWRTLQNKRSWRDASQPTKPQPPHSDSPCCRSSSFCFCRKSCIWTLFRRQPLHPADHCGRRAHRDRLNRRLAAPDAGGHFIGANAATYPLVDAGRLTMEAKDSSTASVKSAAWGRATGNQQALPVPLR
jgi:hypothetical protein